MPARKPPARKRAAPLEKYREKRNFTKTPEPSAKVARGQGNSFVVQEHHARSLHYDFRLEMDGVLVSWAVPKGIPEDTAAKRLAVHVEDHPLDYGGFEGVIPEGNYGAGRVSIWDKGTWEPIGKDWKKQYASGKLKFVLRGSNLKGAYLLARMKDDTNWLMRKLDDKDIPVRPDVKLDRETPDFISPQLARPVPNVPIGEGWLHELKFDGYRLIAVRKKSSMKLFTRSGLDWTDKFSGIAKRLAAISKKDFVMDGEAVVFDGKGRSSFGGLQSALQAGDQEHIEFVAFDLLHLDGENLRDLPLSMRVERLKKLVPEESGAVRRSKVWPSSSGKELFKQACKTGLEGIISKSASGRYHEGSRKDWVKSKCRARQEFVVCGYTPPKGSLPAFGALVLASCEHGKMVPRGKVGTGFTEASRRKLLKLFQTIPTTEVPFRTKEPGVKWIKPQLVAEIEFAEITRDGSIRQGSFVGMREDKEAKDVQLDPLQITSTKRGKINVAGIPITHPERLVYPDDGISKLEVTKYYERVGPMMLPFVKDRPLSVLRAPDGISGSSFFQKSFSNFLPEHVLQQDLEDGSTVFSIRTLKGLVSLAQFGVIEFHLWGAKLPAPEKPDLLVWDLDPDPDVPWKEVLGGAFLTRDCLAGLGLETEVKTSGGKGLHIVLKTKRTLEWDEAKEFTKAVANIVAEHNPQRFITTASKSKRKGKIFIDWLRNGRGATCVAPWSLRARPGASVSMPLNWEDLSEATAAGFTIREPSSIPSEWKRIKPQTITKAMLRNVGL
ncbi:MAG: DNA ligase D [Verrucomicrobiaceae bacterium]|nr:MAG: DNA ligase D [Verrucomicrobiaceae bacterium]